MEEFLQTLSSFITWTIPWRCWSANKRRVDWGLKMVPGSQLSQDSSVPSEASRSSESVRVVERNDYIRASQSHIVSQWQYRHNSNLSLQTHSDALCTPHCAGEMDRSPSDTEEQHESPAKTCLCQSHRCPPPPHHLLIPPTGTAGDEISVESNRQACLNVKWAAAGALEWHWSKKLVSVTSGT